MSDLLRDFIETSNLKQGARLPPERELCEKLGVPRSALRKMLAEMEADGLLTRHVGRGTFIGRPSPPIAALPSMISEAQTYPAEVFEARLLLEPKLASLCAHRASPAELNEMADILDQARKPTSLADFEKADSAFHKTIVRSARNTLLASLYEGIDSVRAGRLWGRLKEHSLTEERMAVYRDHHDAIFKAIQDRNGELAESLMFQHIHHAKVNIIGEY